MALPIEGPAKAIRNKEKYRLLKTIFHTNRRFLTVIFWLIFQNRYK
jgi:hypothetical protein